MACLGHPWRACLPGRPRRYLVSQHPEVEARLVAELDQAGLLVTKERPHPRGMVYGDLSSLTYLNWVCKVGVAPAAVCGSDPQWRMHGKAGLHWDHAPVLAHRKAVRSPKGLLQGHGMAGCVWVHCLEAAAACRRSPQQ